MSQLLDPRERTDRGIALQAEVNGQSPAPAGTPVEESVRDFVYAEVWSRPGLDRRSRYLISMAGAVMSAAGDAMIDGYVRGALKSGELSLAELREAALHLSVYGGWPRGQELDAAINRAQQALGLKPAECPPIRGEAWDPVERGEKGQAEFTKTMTFPGGPSSNPFQEAINNFVFGEMWWRPGLDERARRWITLVAVANSAAEIPIKSHFYAGMKSGNCTREEMLEFSLQYGVHAGWPRASLVNGIIMQMAQKVEAGLGWNE
ncbi:carboxymuconolactone decarboxylase family protein [Novosphingobium sp. G106]|uniref:carboxymuconolactone decarboxylase family protein n=1 Tax=Novosphingobium sp. G106 TaxID=2849500 RepID=UPI001C2CDF28|nr:carboxymuconolactone decarboxylase family protein [Novosphingobium sp. G106]MBV1686827.1 carboxymuconolactone decarboxylase family protein [Novosphingobium sp. G106]